MFRLISKFLRPDDFANLRHLVVFRNDTSGMTYFDPKNVRLGGLETEGLSMSIPEKSVQKGHMLSLFLYKIPLSKKQKESLKKGNPKESVEIVGKVIDLAIDSDGTYATIQFSQYDEYGWQNIVKAYEKKQSLLTNLIKKAKEENVES